MGIVHGGGSCEYAWLKCMGTGIGTSGLNESITSDSKGEFTVSAWGTKVTKCEFSALQQQQCMASSMHACSNSKSVGLTFSVVTAP